MEQHRSLMYERFLPVIDRLVPLRLRKTSAVLRRVESFLASSLLALAGAPLYGIFYDFLGDEVGARFCIMATFGVLANVLVFRALENLALARNTLITIIFCLLLGLTYRLGRADAPTVIWLAVCPIAAMGAGGRAQGLIWSLIVFCAIVALYVFDVLGGFPPSVVTDMRLLGIVSIVTFLPTVALIVLLFEQVNTRAVMQLDEALKNIRAEKEKAQVTLQSIGDAVITTDADMLIEYLNPIAETLTGWTTAEAKGMHMDAVFKIYNENSRHPAANPIAECLEKNGIVEMENHTILVRRTDNEEFHIEDSAAPIRHADGSILGAVMVFHDVTDRKTAQKRLQHIAYHDTMTGLPNRALFRKKLSKAMTDARFLDRYAAVLFLDLDRFKTINDSLGHGIGDELLIMVAKRLEQCIRDSDVICRMGGDEFTAVLSSISSPENAATVAEKIIESISKPFTVQGHQLRISASIGITIYPDDGEDLDGLLKNADTAMYYAKEQGRNNYQYYNATMSAVADNQLYIGNALHCALENNEFFLEYQPKLDLQKNMIVGGEALLRWQSPEFGRVMPAEFIPILEESGAIIPVGNWVLKTAVSQAKQWLDAGYGIVVSVNVSARQFRHDGLVQQIDTLLKSVSLPPALLQLEITESLLMDDADRGELIMRELRNIGVKVSLDDFGTGYSSLSYLRRFPINELKIDRSFVVDMEANETAEKIIKTVIELGQALGMKVTAEGVETEKQRQYLRRIGCNEIQGYLLSRPLQIDAFEALMLKSEFSSWDSKPDGATAMSG